MIRPTGVAGRPHLRSSQQAALDLRGYSYRLRTNGAEVSTACWFLGTQIRGGKREHGATSDRDDVNRGCPRNCERRAASVMATGKLGRPDAKLRPASQETCQHRHPTGGRGAPYGADFRSGDSTTEARAAFMACSENWLNKVWRPAQRHVLRRYETLARPSHRSNHHSTIVSEGM
jgi:hypothetical protein